jgi:hypothetical protein
MPTTSSQNFKENKQPLLSTMSHRSTAAGNAALAPSAKNLDQQVNSKQSDKDLIDYSNPASSLVQTHLQSQNDSEDNKKQSDEEWFEEYVKHQTDFDYTGDEDYLYESNDGGTYKCHICRERVQAINAFQTQPCDHHFCNECWRLWAENCKNLGGIVTCAICRDPVFHRDQA